MVSTTNVFATVRAAISVFVPGAGPATTLITALLETEAARTTQLDRLERKVDDLRDQPWRQGLRQLREARDVAGRERQALQEAVASFKQAHAVYEREPELSFWAAWQVSTASYALGELEQSRYWIMLAHRDAVGAIEQRCKDADNVPVGGVVVQSRRISGVVAFFVFAAVAVVLGITLLPGAFDNTGGFVGLVVGLLGLGFVIFFVAGLGASAAEKAADAVDAALKTRFKKRVMAVRELVASTEEIEQTAQALGVDPVSIERHGLRIVDRTRTVNYLPLASAQRPSN